MPSHLIIGCGYLGRVAARRRLAAGHRVAALTRSRADELRALGFRWFDPDDIRGLQAWFQPASETPRSAGGRSGPAPRSAGGRSGPESRESLLDHNQRLASEHFSFESLRRALSSLLADAGWLP